jgi:hypothetical protein
MSEAHFTNITIVGNSTSKPPRKDGRSREGRDQYIITFSLSSHVKSPWIETFNRIWEARNRQSGSINLPVVSDNQVQLTCPLDDRLQNHLDELRQAFAAANQRYREHLQAADDEKRTIEGILQRLRF